MWSPMADGYILSPTSPGDAFHLGVGYWVLLNSQASVSHKPNMYKPATPGPFSISRFRRAGTLKTR